MSNGIITRIIALLFVALRMAVPCRAQLGIGGGMEYGMAIFANKPVFVKRPAAGVCAELSFSPGESRLFPSFSYLLKSILVPVHNTSFSNEGDFATMQNLMLKLNYRTSDGPHYSLLFFGVGAASIVPENDLSDNQGSAIAIADTGSINLYPAVEMGIRYMQKILPNGGFYLGLEGSVRYIRMHSQNDYYLRQGTTLASATIGGDIILPGIAVTLQYFFIRNGEAD